MQNDRYWIWLQNVMGYASRTYDVLSVWHSAKEIYNADKDLLRASQLFSDIQLRKMEITDLSIADKVISDCEEKGWKIVNYEDEEYPPQLRQISDFPLVLYVSGDVKCLTHEMPIGVIGTRKPSQYAIDVAETISIELAKRNALIVSGGAQGIDSVAHNSAMDAGGKTVVIMGCGLGYDYLSVNEPMRNRAEHNGAVITEYPPYTSAKSFQFVQRNRITAAFCKGVLVVEAGEKSGSLSTANRVLKYNKDLFVVTGDARGKGFVGANKLAQNGARVVFSADDILTLYGFEIRNRDSFYFSGTGKAVFEGIDDYPEGKNEKPKKRKNKNIIKAEKSEKTEGEKEKSGINTDLLSQEAKTVYKAISEGEAYLDDIAKKTRIQIRDVLVALTELEFEGIVECGAGNEYRIR
ncbi:MAG: DNA-protecting protein DprA [Ruminococcaceae bacterium]|nr:DNA-protecting protein DprA [Oscillospiraceae bacterium]